jgi:hypothetical protein
MFGHLGCGTGLVDGMFGVLVFGLVRLLATAHGIVAVGTRHLGAVGITVVVTGVDFPCHKGNPVV